MIHINHMSKQWPLSKLFHHGEKITKKEKRLQSTKKVNPLKSFKLDPLCSQFDTN